MDKTFNGCTSLKSIIIPDSVTGIWDWAFSGCTSLTSVTFEGTISNFGASYFPEFPGDLQDKYRASNGGPGIYTRFAGGETWRKQ